MQRLKKFSNQEDLKIYHLKLLNTMRLRTNAKRKLNKALVRVEKTVIMDVRKNLDQQKKWKAKVVNNKSATVVNIKGAATDTKVAA